MSPELPHNPQDVRNAVMLIGAYKVTGAANFLTQWFFEQNTGPERAPETPVVFNPTFIPSITNEQLGIGNEIVPTQLLIKAVERAARILATNNQDIEIAAAADVRAYALGQLGNIRAAIDIVDPDYTQSAPIVTFNDLNHGLARVALAQQNIDNIDGQLAHQTLVVAGSQLAAETYALATTE